MPSRHRATRAELEFDSFYHVTRRALLRQAFALTGDAAAATAGVEDAYTAAWQRWRKVGRLSDPLDWVRPRAWRLAQRRRGRLGDLGAPSSAQGVLAALGRLPTDQRQALLLTRLGGLSLPHAARAMGVDTDSLVRLRDEAHGSLAEDLGIGSGAVRDRLLSMGPTATPHRLPRASVIRRAGSRRRSTRRLVAFAAAAGVVVGSGAVLHQAPDDVASARAGETGSRPEPRTPAPEPTNRPRPALSAAELLDHHQVSRLGAGQRWRTTRTHDNTSGDGINHVCQEERFADPDGTAALVRQFTAMGGPRRSAVQTVEISASRQQARRAFRTTLGWYAGCQVTRFQLLDAYRVDDIGDEAQVLMARVWSRPVTTYSVAIARSGRVVTSTVGRTVAARAAAPAQVAQSLDDAVSMLCAAAGSDDCSHDPTFTAVPPPPSGEERGLLAVADLPPVGRIAKPWVGTGARPAQVNPAMTPCDRADLTRADVDRTRTRSFLIPTARVPRRFGLSETYAEFTSRAAARSFLAAVRSRLARCEDRNQAATVTGATSVRTAQPDTEASRWVVRTEISDDESVVFRTGFVRSRDVVAQVTFSPARNDDITSRQFDALLVRAGHRLREVH